MAAKEAQQQAGAVVIPAKITFAPQTYTKHTLDITRPTQLCKILQV